MSAAPNEELDVADERSAFRNAGDEVIGRLAPYEPEPTSQQSPRWAVYRRREPA
jgi:hypothetical protein